VQSIFLHILYDSTEVAYVRLPEKCRRGAFRPIGYADTNKPEDLYGFTGPVIAPVRIPQTIRRCPPRRDWVHGLLGSVFDDVNKGPLGRA